MVRREAFGGGFDESLRVGEDVDLVWRMGDAGWLVRHEASAVVQHPARSSWSAWWRQREGYGRSAAALKVRHPDKVDALRVDLWTLSTWLAVASGRPRAALGVLAAARRSLLTQLPERVEDAGRVATEIVARGVLRAPGPLARSSVRSYAPLLVLGAMLAKTRRPVILVLALGTAWRWRRHGVPRPVDALVGVADDLAYATGVWRGALEVRSGAVLVPRVTGSTSSLRAALARSTTKPPPPEMDDGGSRY
jgi:hypothetical protein